MKNGKLKLSTNLKKLMRQSKVTFAQLGIELSIPKSTLFNIAEGAMPRNHAHLKKICSKFSVTADELLWGKPSKNSLENIIREGDEALVKILCIKKKGK